MWERLFFTDAMVLAACFSVSFFRPVGGGIRCTSGHQEYIMRLYNGRKTEEWREANMSNAASLLQVLDFDPQRPSVFYFFGHNESPQNGSSISIVNGYVSRGDHNLWLVDWRPLSSAPYRCSVAGVPGAARHVAAALTSLRIPEWNVHLVGHSMGAQLAAAVGRLFQGHFHRITALDPALPLFDFLSLVPSISAKDAQNVDIIHTDGGKYGISQPSGTIDFYPNGGGRLQPGCLRKFIYVNDLCSHQRSWELYAESLLRPEAFPAVRCTSWKNFKSRNCSNTQITYMGILATTDSNIPGSYFLRTGAASPYGLGKEGTCIP